MKTLLLLTLLAVPSLLPAQERKPPTGMAVTLSDGSILISSGIDDALSIRTPYGDQKVPIREIRTARRLPSGTFTIQANGLSITGELGSRELTLNTSLGPQTVSTDDLRMISLPNGLRSLQDDAAVALWWFAETADGRCRDLVKNRVLTLQSYERAEDASGAAHLVARGPAPLGIVASDADLDLGDEDCSVEVRFKVPAQPRTNVMVLEKGNPVTGIQDFQLYACTNGVLSAYATRTGQTVQSPPNSFRRDGWNTCTIVQRAQPPSTTIYVNGKPCGTVAAVLFSTGLAGLEWHLGSHPRFGTGCEAPEAVQFLRFSRRLRTPEEIADLERGWDSWQHRNPAHRGVLLQDGSFLRGDVASVDKMGFRTRFGDLKLGDKAGQILLYRLRPSEVERERAAIPALVEQLGAPEIREREAAMKRLLALAELAVPVLRSMQTPADKEIANRVAEVLKKLDESGAARRASSDVLQVGGLSVQGWLDQDPVVVNTKRGRVQLAPAQIAEIHLGLRYARPRPLLRLHSGETAEFEPAEEARLQLDAGFGPLSIPADELKELSFDADRRIWSVTTERLTATGRLTGSLPIVTPVGALTLPWTEVRSLKSSPSPTAAVPAPPPIFEDR